MKEYYSIDLLITSAEYALPSKVYYALRSNTSEEDMKQKCNEFLNRMKSEYNEHIVIRLWLHRNNNIDQMIYEIEK